MDNEEEIDVNCAPTFTEAEDALLNDPDPAGALLDRLWPAVWAPGNHLEACTDAAHRVVTEVLNSLGRRVGQQLKQLRVQLKRVHDMSGVIHCPASVSSNSHRLDGNANNLPSTVTVVYDP